jgi:hypothetical protein
LTFAESVHLLVQVPFILHLLLHLWFAYFLAISSNLLQLAVLLTISINELRLRLWLVPLQHILFLVWWFVPSAHRTHVIAQLEPARIAKFKKH